MIINIYNAQKGLKKELFNYCIMAKGNAKKVKTTTNTVVDATPAKDTVEKTTTPVETSHDDSQWAALSADFLTKLQAAAAAVNALKAEWKTLDKTVTKQLKTAQRLGAKRKRKSGNRSPSGFVKPTLISDELASFLGKDKGCEMARTEVTREINKYIRAQNLQDKDNGRKINPDVKLAKLLKLKKSDELTYFNLQRYMSPHFAKNGATTAPVTNA